MGNRVNHRRMAASELSGAMADLNLTVGDLMRLTGATRWTISQWLAGTGDIPHWLAVLTAVLRRPEALRTAVRLSDESIIADRETQRGTPYRDKAERAYD